MTESIYRVMSLVPVVLFSIAINNFIKYAIRMRRGIKKQIRSLAILATISSVFFIYYTLIAQGKIESNAVLASLAMGILCLLCKISYTGYLREGEQQ